MLNRNLPSHSGPEPTFHPDRLDVPLHWRKPRRIFVCSMSDLFHEAFTDEQIDRVWDVMTTENHTKAGSWNGTRWTWYPHHTFMVLTKRPERMREYVLGRQEKARRYADQFNDCPTEAMQNSPAAVAARQHASEPDAGVWLGVTAENQARADERIPILLDTLAAVRFVSVEPMLEPVDLRQWMDEEDIDPEYGPLGPSGPGPWLDWAICGPETGPGKRPFESKWAVDLRNQCVAADVPYFDKRDSHADRREFPQEAS